MNGITTLILILTPMFVGLLLPVNAPLAKVSEKALNAIVFLILVLIGMELAQVEDLFAKLGAIATYLLTLMALTIGLGVVGLYFFDKLSPCPYYRVQHSQGTTPPSLRGSLVQVGCLLAGFVLGVYLPDGLHPPAWANTVLLMGLLLLVGILLKNANIGIKAVLLNKRGLQLSLVFMAIMLVGGLVFAWLFDEVSWTKGLALASGMGWYSLSGTIMTNAYGAIWGSVALLNDLLREVLALLFIPYVMRLSSSAAIGLGGVTSLDFTLPTIQKSGGSQIVPLVISFGFITNVVSPILMVFFSSF